MADDLKDEIKLSMDASGVETGVNSAKRSIDSLGTTVANVSKRGGDGLAQIGKGGEEAGRKVEQVTKNMVSSLQRQIAAAEAGSTSTRQYYESIARLRGANMDVLKPYLDQLDAVKSKTDDAKRATESMSKIGALLGAAVGSMALKGFVQVADSITTLNNQLKLATGSAAAASIAYASLFDIAQRSRVSFTELGSTYASIARATGELGISQQRMLKVTESIANAMTISGGSAQSMQAALVQLSQGMASGVLRGEELNSVMEQAPRLAKALADGLGVPIGKLREMGAAGEITSEQVVKALESQSAILGSEVSGAVMTVSQAFTQLTNSSVNAIGEFDKASGASKTLAEAISAVAKAVDTVGKSFKEHEGVIVTTLGVLGGAATAAGVLRVAGAISGAGGIVAAISAVRVAFVGLTAVMAANPVGLALLGIGAVTGAVIANNRGPSSTEGLAREIEWTTQRIAKAESQLAASGGSKGELTRRLEERIVAMKKYRDEMQQTWAGQVGGSVDTRAEDARLGAHTEQMKAQSRAAEELATIKNKLNGVDKDYQPTLNKLFKQYQDGNLTLNEYQDLVGKLATANYKAEKSSKGAAAAANDAISAQVQAYRNADKEILDGRKSFYDQLALMQRLGVTGEFEALDQSVAKEEEVWAKRKANFEAEIAQAAKKKNSQTEVAKLTGQMQDAERDYLQNAAKLQGDLAQLEQKRIADLEKRIDKQGEVARLAGEQVATAQLEGKAIGLTGDALREQNQALLENKLKKLESLAVDADKEVLSGRLGAAYRLEAEELRRLNVEQSKNRAKQLVADYVKGVEESNRLIQEEVGLLGLSSTEREIALERLRIQIELEKRLNQVKAQMPPGDERTAEIAKLEAAAAIEMSNAANKVILNEWKKTTDQINSSLTDALLRGFEDGKGFAENFRDTLKNLFRTLVLRPIISFIVQPIGNIVGGVISGVLGTGSGGGSILGSALSLGSGASSAYSLMNGTWGAGLLGNSYVYGAAVPGLTMGGTQAGMLAAQTGEFGYAGLSATSSAGSGAAGAGVGAGAALPFLAAALGWLGAEYFDKGDSFSGAAYATSGGNDRETQVISGALDPNVNTGDLPDRDAITAHLIANGANESDLTGLNTRQLHRLMLLSDGEIANPSNQDVGPRMNWKGWIEANKDLPDFYQGAGYAFPEDLGMFEVQDRGSRESDRSWDSYHVDPRVVEASRQLSLGILDPIKSISKMLGNDDAFKVATGLAYNDKTGKITGGLQISRNGESLVKWDQGGKEFDNRDEYLRSTFSDSLGALETLDGIPEWMKKQVDGAQEQIAKLEGENIGEQAGAIFVDTTNKVQATFKQIETLIETIPDLTGLTQDAVYSIGELFGSLDNYSSAYSGYIQNYYSEDERKAYVRSGINKTLGEHGLSVDENTTREDYRALIEAQDLTTESGRAAYAVLIMLSDAFAQITPAAEDATKATERLADMRKTQAELEAEWLALTGDLTAADELRRKTAIEGMSAEEVAQYDSNAALQARIDKEKEFQQTLSGINSSLTNILTEGLLGNLSEADLGGQMADAVIGGVYNALANNAAQQITDMMMTTIIQPMVKAALAGSLTAETVSRAAIENMVANAKAVMTALGVVFNDPVFKQFLADIDAMIKDIAGSAPAQPYYSAYANQQKEVAQAAEQAAEKAESAWEGVGDTLMDQVKKIRGDIAGSGLESLSYWQSEFAIETAKARAGDVDAASGLSALSGSLLDAASKESQSQLELNQLRAWVAQSLQDTAAYANAFAAGSLTPRSTQTQTTIVTPTPVVSQLPMVISADPNLLAELRELRRVVKEQGDLLISLQTEGVRIERRRENFGTSVYIVDAPA